MTHLKSEWITANAGSGKTTALTERVVKLLLLGVAAEHIVCITYTKAAASEMRARVLEMLRSLLLASDAACAAQIEKLMGAPADAETMARARSLFGTVLDSASGGVQLTTIHGFCQNILRRFPMEANIAPHFTVLEEAAAEEALAQAKYGLLVGLQSAGDDLKQALAIIGARGGEARFESIAADIIKQRRHWDAIWHMQDETSLRGHIWTFHGLAHETTQAALDAHFCKVIGAEDAALLRDYVPELLAQKTKTNREMGEGLAAWLAADVAQRHTRRDDFITLFMTKDGEPRKTLLTKEYPPDHPLSMALQRVADGVMRYAEQTRALAIAEESFAVAVVAKTLFAFYRAAKQARHALDYDDLIAHTLDLLVQPETLGWVMSKLDHRIDHLLIDEAQDNGSAMWQLAHTLVEELVATADGPVPRSVLVVGDEKQSIYSFQGAAPEQFARYRAVFDATLAQSAGGFAVRALAMSYRSTASVLRLVNDLCAQPIIREAIGFAASGQPHQLTRTQAYGRVCLYPPTLAQEKQTQDPMALPMESRLQTAAPQLLAEQIANTIHQWLVVQKRPLASAGRLLRAGDILILVKNRNPLVMPLMRALQRRDIPVAGLDRLVLADHLAVRDLLALMAWCDNVSDDLALAQVLRSPLLEMTDEALCALAYGRPASLWQQVQEPWLLEILAHARATPYAFLTQVLEIAGKRRAFAKRFGAEVHEVLDELKAQAANMPATMLPTLANFCDWVGNSTRSIKREQESVQENHVRIMTIHGAKGLEAPLVMMADTVSVPTTQREQFFVAIRENKQKLPLIAMSAAAKLSARLSEAKQRKRSQLFEEYYRLLYVATTRARDELHVFGIADGKGEVKEDSWYAVIAQSMRALNASECDGVLEISDGEAAPTAQQTPVTHHVPPMLPAWAQQPPPAEVETIRRLSPSSLAPTPVAMGARSGAMGAKERGVRLHRVLELMDAKTDEKSAVALITYVAPDWSAAEQAKAVTEVMALHAKERWLWEHERMPEVSLVGTLMHQGVAIPMSGQIDLLVRTPDALVIVDFKTGSHRVSDANEVPLAYVLQLKTYQALVSQIYPNIPVRCAIVWTQTAQLIWLDERVKNTPFPELNVMLKTSVAA